MDGFFARLAQDLLVFFQNWQRRIQRFLRGLILQLRRSFLAERTPLEALLAGLFLLSLVVFIWIAATNPDLVGRAALSLFQQIAQMGWNWISSLLPDKLPQIHLPERSEWRQFIAPLGAVLIVVVQAGYFVQDVFSIPRLNQALRYLVSSLTYLFLPSVNIDRGRVQVTEGQYHPITSVGGPGRVIVQPGNAVVFRNLRAPSRSGMTRSVTLNRFERIGFVSSLEEQADQCQEITTMTRDGIMVRLAGVRYRYSIITNPNTRRTLDNPFPFDLTAVERQAYNLPVSERGQSTVAFQVRLLVGTAVRRIIADQSLDFLTAPRDIENNRAQLHQLIMRDVLTWGIGVQLLMVNVGFIEVMPLEVAESRTNAWAVPWAGAAEVQRGEAEGTRLAYSQLASAQSQARLIMTIAAALKEAGVGPNSTQTIRAILLSYTGQVISQMRKPVDVKRDRQWGDA